MKKNPFAKKETQSTKEVVTRQSTDVAIPDMEDYAVDMGNEEYSLKDLPRPVFKLVQAQSDLCKKASESYNPDAREGMFYLNSTKELFTEDDFLLVPVTMQKREVQYLIDGDKRIYKGEHLENSDITKNIVIEPNPKGGADWRVVNQGDQKTILVETAIWYCLLIIKKDGVTRWNQVTISLSSSQLRASSDWLGYLHGIKVPSSRTPGKLITPAFFWRAYKAGCAPKSNDQHSWVIWTFREEMQLDVNNNDHAALINDAAAYYNDIKAGSVKVDHDEA
jgi:hypothetical protein